MKRLFAKEALCSAKWNGVRRRDRVIVESIKSAMKLEEIKDPLTRARVEEALRAASALKRAVQLDGLGPPSVPTKPAKIRKRIRQDEKPLMNKLEQEYHDTFLIEENNVCIQSMRFRLATGLWYKPDFFYINYDGLPSAIEVKGPHAYRGGFENLKMAAHQYQWINWVLAWKENGGWKEQVVLP